MVAPNPGVSFLSPILSHIPCPHAPQRPAGPAPLEPPRLSDPRRIAASDRSRHARQIHAAQHRQSRHETPRITELHVRMDCNGCVHKIRKTLSGIEGIGEVYVDQANHKVTVVGLADPERIVKAIRKTKKVPTICSHTDPTAEAQAPAPPAEGEAPPPPADPPADAPPPAEAAPAEPAPQPVETPATDATVIHMVHDYPYNHPVHREHWANHPNMHGIRYEAAPYYAAHSYSHRPTPYISEHGHDYNPAARGKGDGSQITSMFSDENPNACSIA